MSNVAVRDLNASLWQLGVDADNKPRELGRKNDAQVAVKELQVLRADLDMVAPPEVAEVAEPLVKLFQGELSSGDHLRLPQLTQHDGPSLQRAIGRVLDVDTGAAGASREAVVKEEKMRRVLTALQYAVQEIQHKASLSTGIRY